MTRTWIAFTGLLFLAGCSGGGGDQGTQAPAPPTAAPTEFVAATSEGLWRGQPNGKGGVVFAYPNLQREDVLLGDGYVSYSRNEDIWTVNTDGTGNRALVNTPLGQSLHAVKGPWVFYAKSQSANDDASWKSVHVDTGQQAILSTKTFDYLQQLVGTRAVFSDDIAITSVNFDGTDRRIHFVGNPVQFLFTRAAIEQPATVLYEWHHDPPQLFSVSLAEGAQAIPLDTDVTSSTYYAGHSGGRVVYRRCDIAAPLEQCNVLSVLLNGTQTAVLAAQPENEAVQGIIGERVVIRRNVNGNDQLVSVPITGGAETFIMLLGDTDFIEVVAGDALVLRRSTGTWRLDLNGTLTKLGPTPGGHAYQVVGTAVCYNVNAAYYCAPLDGSGPEVKIAGNGKFVGVL